jgi:DNA polymerase III delta prime subunit
MDQFDIGRLTDLDFEILCRDLLVDRLQVPLELFAPGVDKGVDLRHFESKDRTLVVQCKHWSTSSRAALIRHMRVSEKPKIDSLQPQRYILATSANLTVKAKDELLKILHPYTTSGSDILGLLEIIEELRYRPHIVRRHIRLWLNSTEVLQSLLNRSIVSRSQALRDDIQATLRTYVPNESFSRAHALLEDRHVCIIAGIPGVGKTTLAQALSAVYLESEYELVDITDDVGEIDEAWSEDRPQLFYFDDFLGQTALDDKLNKNEDRRLLSLIRRIHSSKTKRLILTTREYILAQARERYERLANASFDPLTAIVDMSDYTPTLRAEILYNHVFFSGLSRVAKASFAAPAKHLPIVSHPNFNPRLIEMTLTGSVTEGVEADPATAILDNFNNPNALWRHIVEHQLDRSKLALLETLFTLHPTASLDVVQDSWRRYGREWGEAPTSLQFKASLRALDGTMIRTSRSASGDKILISFHNPSIRDYLRDYLAENDDVLLSLLRSMHRFDQVVACWVAAGGTPGRALRSALLNHWNESLAAIERTALPYDDRVLDDWRVNEIATLLRMSLEVRDARLNKVMLGILDQVDAAEIDDGAAAVNLLRLASESEDDRVRGWAAGELPGVMDWVLGDLWNWDNASFAQQLVEDLGELAPEWGRLRVERALDEAAERVIDRATSQESFDASTLREALEHAGRYSDPEELFPGYHFAEQLLMDYEESLEAPRVELPRPDPARERQSVSAIFESLRELP